MFPYASHVHIFPLFIRFILFAELDAVLFRSGQGVSPDVHPVIETSDTSGD